jgi:hypothetical protein
MKLKVGFLPAALERPTVSSFRQLATPRTCQSMRKHDHTVLTTRKRNWTCSRLDTHKVHKHLRKTGRFWMMDFETQPIIFSRVYFRASSLLDVSEIQPGVI